RLAGSWLVLFGAGYAALELAVVAGAVLGGVPPASAVAAGLPTDPVLVLDLAFVLPGMAACGLLVRRRRAAALLLAVPALAFSTAMGVAVLNMLVVTGLRLPPFPTVVVAGFVLITAGHATVLARVLRAMHPGVRLAGAVEPRRPAREDRPAATVRVS
ncbi:MAG TPA: hypothetical protein VNU01_11605, partial [Egibacteraceae bacterium]|nr:hypothetical protein [Egibacteraceae bacterium]